jgi:hypothetical protein
MHISYPPVHAACPAHLLPLNLIIWIAFNEQYKSWSSWLRSFLQFPFTYPPLRPKHLPQQPLLGNLRRLWKYFIDFIQSMIRQRASKLLFTLN